jgi:hypothetical protein
MFAYALLMSQALRNQDTNAAIQNGEKALEIVKNSTLSSFFFLAAFDILMRNYVELWKNGQADTARLVLKCFAKYGRHYNICKPVILRYQASLTDLEGQTARAMKLWQQSRVAAEELHMPYEIGMAFYEMAQRLPAAEQVQLLTQAVESFGRIGAQPALEAVKLSLPPDSNDQ